MAKINIRPLDDRVVVRPIDAEQTTAGGIVLPDSAQEKPQRGTVLAVGPGRLLDSGTRGELSVGVGDEERRHLSGWELVGAAAVGLPPRRSALPCGDRGGPLAAVFDGGDGRRWRLGWALDFLDLGRVGHGRRVASAQRQRDEEQGWREKSPGGFPVTTWGPS